MSLNLTDNLPLYMHQLDNYFEVGLILLFFLSFLSQSNEYATLWAVVLRLTYPSNDKSQVSLSLCLSLSLTLINIFPSLFVPHLD